MLKSRSFLVFSTLVLCSLSALGQDSDALFSPSVGQKFYEIAYEMVNTGGEDVSRQEAEQAIIFLMATMNLDSRGNYILPEMIKIISRYSEHDRSELVYQLLEYYIDEDADLEVMAKTVRYLLDRQDSREGREKLLDDMLKKLGGENSIFDSELATLLGLLMIEKTDLQAAQSYIMQAYNDNKYNKQAFEMLVELMPDQIGPATYLEHLRLVLSVNPFDLEAALAFAQYAEQLQLYQSAVEAYEYCADLFRFLYPSEALPAYIYLPWAISSYNTQRNQHKCLQIASEFRQSGRFDLFLEAIAGKAAAKIGDDKQARDILDAAEARALQLIMNESSTETIEAQQLAWFYCFALPDANKAIDWANKVYSSEPNSAISAGILAYSLVMNGQTDWARPLVDNYPHNQILELTLAQIQVVTEEQQSLAIETLKSAIARDPGSLEAERAKEILALLGSEYISPIDPDIILAALKNGAGQSIVPVFMSPEKAISVELNVRGSSFSYGSEFGGTIVITNNSSQPLAISDDGLLSGNIRIDADISGDLSKKIPNLVSVKIRPALPVAQGQSILIPLRLVTGELRQILIAHPQASLNIEFTAFVDPVANGQVITNRLAGIKPAQVVIERPGIAVTGRYFQNRLNSLSNGRQAQKIKTAQLFAGLLLEQHAMANREPLYKFVYADWMPDLLKSVLLQTISDDDWVVNVHTMSAMVSLPLDYELISALSENLNDSHWPVRLMSIYLLAKSRSSNFDKVLDWNAEYDPNKLVRDMAIALGGENPQARQQANPSAPGN